ncbi:MAG: ester cyclase [Alphaproteobacteria bacterium]|nr:ester cyclase [Alphaproteobacteria bacterium]
MPDDFRAIARNQLNTLIMCPESELEARLSDALTDDTVWDVSDPVGQLRGPAEVLTGLIRPLRTAFPHTRRRDEIFIGGNNRRDVGGLWVASVTHYLGTFSRPLFGISPSTHLSLLRSGEFYRIENGRIAEAKLIIDFIDLMRQAGRYPLPAKLGAEITFPGPATHDGVLPDNPERGERSLDIIEGMIRDLHEFDPDTFESKDQTGKKGYWHEDMLWYGPAGIGSNYRWDGFVQDHREPFLRAFPDREGGDHYCRIGDGDYAAISGWPSMTMTHRGDYLGIAATNRALTLRVMDFYRCADGQIMENWVMLDYLHLFDQMGVDLIARSEGLMNNED